MEAILALDPLPRAMLAAAYIRLVYDRALHSGVLYLGRAHVGGVVFTDCSVGRGIFSDRVR